MIAATPPPPTPCVTQAEYKAVRVGWSMRRVHHTFGTYGARYNWDTLVVERTYVTCGPWGQAYLSYSRAGDKPLIRKGAVIVP